MTILWFLKSVAGGSGRQGPRHSNRGEVVVERERPNLRFPEWHTFR